MSYYVTNENSVLNINNAHLKVSGNVMTDVMKLGAIEFAPPASDVGGTVNFTNVTTGVTTSSNLSVGGTLQLGTVEVVATTHTLANTTANGNVTPHTVQFSNATTGIVTTANVEVGGDLAVSGNVADLNVVSNVNLLHTSNTAALKLNSNVVTEFPRSKKLIKYPRVVLTGNGLNQGYTVSGSNEYSSGLTFYGAFTPPTTLSTPSGAWLTPTSGTTGYSTSTGDYLLSAQLHSDSLTGEYVQIVLPERINPVHFTVQPRPESANNNQGLISCIKEGEIWASNNSGTTWTLVGTIQNFTPTDLYQQYIVNNINVTGYYDTFALIIHKNNGQTFAGVGEWKIFGTPEYDPEADGTDVVVKSVPNVPNTDWLEVYYDAKNYTSGLVQDLSTNSFNGTLTNGASFNNSDGIDKFVFDGSNDYISGSIPSTFTGNQTYTFSIWVKPDSHPSSGFVGVFEVGTRSSNDSMGLYFDTGKIIHLAYGDNLATTTVATIGHWVHITGTYTSGDRRVYANGNLLKQDDYSGLTLVGTTFKLGSNEAGTQAFNGSIANFRLFNRALTSDEIYQLYAYQKEYFGHGDLGMTLKAGRLGIGTSEPKAALDVQGIPHGPNSRPCWTLRATSVDSDGFVVWNQSDIDNFNGATGSAGYIIPVSGYYFMQVIVIVSASGGRATLRFYKNGTAIGANFLQDPVTTAIEANRPWNQLTGIITYYFKQGDMVKVSVGGSTYSTYNCFTGFHLGF